MARTPAHKLELLRRHINDLRAHGMMFSDMVHLTAVKNPANIQKWLDGSNCTSADNIDRLSVAAELASAVRLALGDHHRMGHIVQFFSTPQPALSDQRPDEFIRVHGTNAVEHLKALPPEFANMVTTGSLGDPPKRTGRVKVQNAGAAQASSSVDFLLANGLTCQQINSVVNSREDLAGELMRRTLVRIDELSLFKLQQLENVVKVLRDRHFLPNEIGYLLNSCSSQNGLGGVSIAQIIRSVQDTRLSRARAIARTDIALKYYSSRHVRA